MEGEEEREGGGRGREKGRDMRGGEGGKAEVEEERGIGEQFMRRVHTHLLVAAGMCMHDAAANRGLFDPMGVQHPQAISPCGGVYKYWSQGKGNAAGKSGGV